MEIMKHIEPSALSKVGLKDTCLIDVRTPSEFLEFHVTGANNIPLDQLSPEKVLALSGAKETPVYMLCRSGSRAKQAAQMLTNAGFSEVFCVTGGSVACKNLGMECIHGERKTISLERQVRIVAGTLVLVGVILGTFVHDAFYGLSAFVGAGLIFAGATDWCGMGILLSKMPWNR